MSLFFLFPNQGAPAGIVGDVAITEVGDTLASGSVLRLSASASLSEASDTLASAGVLPLSAACAVAESADALLAEAVIQVNAVSALVEQADLIVAEASLALSGAAEVTEEADSMTAGGWREESYSAPLYMDPCNFIRYRRVMKRWTDPQGRQWELSEDTGGARHLREVSPVDKPYKPVRGVRIARRPVAA